MYILTENELFQLRKMHGPNTLRYFCIVHHFINFIILTLLPDD